MNKLIYVLYAFVALMAIKTFGTFNKTRKSGESSLGLGLTDAEDEISKSPVFSPALMESAKEQVRKNKKLKLQWATLAKIKEDSDKIENTFDYVLNRTQIGEKMIGIIKSYKNQLQLSQLSDYYQRHTGHDLITNIGEHTHDKALQQILNYSKTLPTGIMKKIK